jgi:hypothetical protein
MNIKDELKKLDYDEQLGEEIIKKHQLKQEELMKKIHIFKSVLLTNKIEKLVSTDIFSKVNINTLKISKKQEKNIGDKIVFYLIDESNKAFSYFDSHAIKQTQILYEVFENFGVFNVSLTNNKLIEHMHISLELKPGIKDKILEIILSKELKKIYEYNKFDLDLPDNSGNNNKKLKL